MCTNLDVLTPTLRRFSSLYLIFDVNAQVEGIWLSKSSRCKILISLTFSPLVYIRQFRKETMDLDTWGKGFLIKL